MKTVQSTYKHSGSASRNFSRAIPESNWITNSDNYLESNCDEFHSMSLEGALGDFQEYVYTGDNYTFHKDSITIIDIGTGKSKLRVEKSPTLDFSITSGQVYISSQVSNRSFLISRLVDIEEIDISRKAKHLELKIKNDMLHDNQRKAIKHIFESLDLHLVNGSFEKVSKIINKLPLETFSGKSLIALLSITNPWKTQKELKPVRTKVAAFAKELLKDEVGEKRSHNILSSLQ